MIDLSKESMQKEFEIFLEKIFSCPEIVNATVKKILIDRENLPEAARQAMEESYHDRYSDIDLSITVRLPKHGPVTPEAYMERIDRFGVDHDKALGWSFIPEHPMYRIIFKNGMRYDFGFAFEYAEEGTLDLGEPPERPTDNENWPAAVIDRFWFIQIQALGKLYRKDYLIASHLANMNCNETLVMQMVLRDLKYGTNHHRYGYSEEPEYFKDLGRSPYPSGDPVFQRIADHLYAAAVSYDRLAKAFYPQYRDRSNHFFAIWDRYAED